MATLRTALSDDEFEVTGARNGTPTRVTAATLAATITSAAIATSLGYTPLNKAGDVIGVGGLAFPAVDPHIAGRWWDNAGTLTKSAG